MELTAPVAYLEKTDFTSSGEIIDRLKRKPIFVMIQSTACGHCRVAKPAFQALANDGIISCLTIQADGQRQSERDLAPLLTMIYPGFNGFPSYMLFINDKKIPYVGGRSYMEMKEFISTYV